MVGIAGSNSLTVSTTDSSSDSSSPNIRAVERNGWRPRHTEEGADGTVIGEVEGGSDGIRTCGEETFHHSASDRRARRSSTHQKMDLWEIVPIIRNSSMDTSWASQAPAYEVR